MIVRPSTSVTIDNNFLNCSSLITLILAKLQIREYIIFARNLSKSLMLFWGARKANRGVQPNTYADKKINKQESYIVQFILTFLTKNISIMIK